MVSHSIFVSPKKGNSNQPKMRNHTSHPLSCGKAETVTVGGLRSIPAMLRKSVAVSAPQKNLQWESGGERE
jgi:hypothetical protein